MNRRELLLGGLALAGASVMGQVQASEHNHMNMGGSHEHHSNPNEKLMQVAADCVEKAQLCLQHCLVLLGEGDKSMAACAKSSSQVQLICTALQGLAAAESRSLPALAKVAMDICKDCEEECKKTNKHAECKACEEACAACYKECKAITV